MASYDGFGRVRTSSTTMGGTTRTLSHQYDRNGNRTQITHPDGVYFTSSYDGLNRPYILYDQTAWREWFAYKHHGALYVAVRANSVHDYWEYDNAQRLYSHAIYFNAPYAASTAIWLFTHNPAPQIASVWRDNDAYAWTGAYTVNRAYTTNGLNQYSAAGTASFTYDANGNLTGDGTNTFTYDIENRLVGRSGGVTLSYDPLGRLYEVAGSVTTRFLYDGDALVAEYVSGAMTRRYVHNVGADVPLLSYAGSGISQPTWLHPDHQGSIVAVSDAGGAGTVNTYDEYGIPGTANTGRFQYTGQAWLAELGMYYYKARIYSPTLGRFLQTDPVGYEGGVNLYAYVGNDPANLIDSTGEKPGQVWSTRRDAGADAARYVNRTSIRQNQEYGGRLLQVGKNQWIATPPGTNGSGTAVNLPAMTPTTGGDYHSHGDYSTTDAAGNLVRTTRDHDTFNSDSFSSTDRTGIAADAAVSHVPDYTAYLATPSGVILEYNPVTGVAFKVMPPVEQPSDPKP